MRRFVDAEGRAWDVVVGRESWGAFFAIFVPSRGETAMRQAALHATSTEGAADELARLNDEGLQAIFLRSQVKDLT